MTGEQQLDRLTALQVVDAQQRGHVLARRTAAVNVEAQVFVVQRLLRVEKEDDIFQVVGRLKLGALRNGIRSGI
ncbi:MAG: hypothetical protein V9H69_00515 [Anaerolineae bacterium]